MNLGTFNLRYDRMVKALRKLGYRVVGLPCNTADYGLPQQRCRAWVMCILESECDSDAEELMVKALKAFKCQPLPLEVLISDNQTSQASQPKPRGKKDEVPKWKTALTWECQRLGKAGWETSCGRFSPLISSFPTLAFPCVACKAPT